MDGSDSGNTKAAEVNQCACSEVFSERDVVCLGDFRKRHRRNIGDKANHVKVRSMTPENAPGLVIDSICVVMRMCSVCRSDTDKSALTRFDDIRHAELTTDFNHFPT